MKKWLNDIFYSFPVQLVILHFRNNLTLIATWILLILLMTGNIGNIFGIRYLFVTPEYLGQVNFLSFFFLGLAFGGFFMTWNLTSYLLESYHFPFLASLSRPFTKFCLNNLVIPLTFVVYYLAYAIYFMSYFEYWDAWTITKNCAGFLLGVGGLIIVSAIYFSYTNKDILSFLKVHKQEPPDRAVNLAPGRRGADVERMKSGVNLWRVDTYLSESLRPRLVRSVAHYDSSVLLSVFRQNHVNALVVQLFGLVVLIILGFLIDKPYFRIPAAASIFILSSVFVAITGAITYWFDKWRIPVFVTLLIAINYLTGYEIFNHKNKAYGMNYVQKKTTYSYEALEQMASPAHIEADKKNTIQILDNWLVRMHAQGDSLPKMVIFCVSGGGMKAMVWAMQVLQQTDKMSGGKLFQNCTLITGASGGLIGTAYLRELFLQQQQGKKIDVHSAHYIDQIAQDLLNSITFTIVANDLFLPWGTFEHNGFTYRKDRGYIFELQLNENTDFVFDKTISDYREPEVKAEIPMLFVTPSIVNDGRRMIISPQGVSYMTIAPIGAERANTVEIDAVDFGRLYKDQGADDLRFATAMRMNATYPYILPNVFLPSVPSIEVMDAGFRDNYGIMSATRFIHVFKDWILENTSGVVLVQVSGIDKIEKIETDDNAGIISTLFNPLGIAGQIMTLQDYEHDTSLGYVFDLLGKEHFDIIRFVYQPSKDNERASMTFHLTAREKADILNSFYLEENQKSVKLLKEAMHWED